MDWFYRAKWTLARRPKFRGLWPLRLPPVFISSYSVPYRTLAVLYSGNGDFIEFDAFHNASVRNSACSLLSATLRTCWNWNNSWQCWLLMLMSNHSYSWHNRHLPPWLLPGGGGGGHGGRGTSGRSTTDLKPSWKEYVYIHLFIHSLTHWILIIEQNAVK